MLNVYELFVIGIQKGTIDYELFKVWNRTSAIQYWYYAHPFVSALRSRVGNDLLFHEFEQMVQWFKADGAPRKRGWKWSRYF